MIVPLRQNCKWVWLSVIFTLLTAVDYCRIYPCNRTPLVWNLPLYFQLQQCPFNSLTKWGQVNYKVLFHAQLALAGK
jgi:hypothetical protein